LVKSFTVDNLIPFRVFNYAGFTGFSRHNRALSAHPLLSFLLCDILVILRRLYG
jgi:hypothetical protein